MTCQKTKSVYNEARLHIEFTGETGMKYALVEVFGAASGHRRKRYYVERSNRRVQQHFRLRYIQISRPFLKSNFTEKVSEKYYYFCGV